MKQPRPVARSRKLIIKELLEETLIYDLESDQAHCLNQTAALVWKHCDGSRGVSELREMIEKKTGLAVPEAVVWLALEQFEKFGLLEPTSSNFIGPAGMKRRQLVRTLGIAAVSLPIIVSMVAPTPAAAGSKTAPGGCCNGPGNCVDGNCAIVPGNPCPENKVCVA